MLTLLLGLTVPRLFREAALYGTADALSTGGRILTCTACAAGVLFALWWTRDVMAARSPADPWDPGHGRRRRAATVAPWIATLSAITGLLAARAHLWDPATPLLYALLVFALLAPAVRELVTDQ